MMILYPLTKSSMLIKKSDPPKTKPKKIKKTLKTKHYKPQIKGRKRNPPIKIPRKDEPKNNWRPTKMDDSTVQKLISFLKYDWTERDACKYAVVPRTTYMWWKKKNYIVSYQFTRTDENGAKITVFEDIWFADLIDYAKLQLTSSARVTLARALDKGNVTAAIEILKRRDTRYRDKIDVDNTGSFNVNFGWPKSWFMKKKPPTWENENENE